MPRLAKGDARAWQFQTPDKYHAYATCGKTKRILGSLDDMLPKANPHLKLEKAHDSIQPHPAGRRRLPAALSVPPGTGKFSDSSQMLASAFLCVCVSPNRI